MRETVRHPDDSRAHPAWVRRSSVCLVVSWLFGCSGAIDYPEESQVEPEAGEPGAQPVEPGPQPVEPGAEPVTPDEASPQASDSGDAEANTPALPTDGPGLYQSQCALCHGDEGAGTEVAPEIQHPPRDYFLWVVRNGLEGAYDSPMLAFPEESLSESQTELILEYLTQLPQPADDAGLYLDYCANCHGTDARGGASNKNIAGKNEFLEVLRNGKGGANFAARNRYMPSWQEGQLTDELVARLEAYVGSLPE